MKFVKRFIGAFAEWAGEKDLLRDVVFLGGAASFVFGMGMIYRPAGFIVAGFLLMSYTFMTVKR